MGIEYCSPAAYKYVRKKFHNHLPAPETIRRWYKSINGEPGITTESMNILKQKAEEYKKEGKELLLAMMFDEMAIKKNVEWNEAESKFSGFVTCENTKTTQHGNEKAHLDIAKDALVFMVVGENFKIPVAYFLLNGLEALERAALAQDVIRHVNETGAKVISFTGDGLISNISVAKHLGCNLKQDKTFFASPTNPKSDKIHFILDPPHMLKLFRGCLATHSLYYNDKPISWDFIVELQKMQSDKNINLGNKLSNNHIKYSTRSMNVRLACETLSMSVADCISQLREDNYDEFRNSSETTNFIKFVDNTFNVGNVRNSKYDHENFDYKYPICESTAEGLFKYFCEAKKYFKSVEIDEKNRKGEMIRKLAINSKSFTPFLGMVINLTSFEGLYNDHVLNGPLKTLYTFQFSQDHLETWFSSVRRGLGIYN